MASIIQTVEGVVANKFIIESVLKFGRSTDNQVQIDDLEVSTNHAQIICDIDNEGTSIYFLEDLGSTNGSFINEEKILFDSPDFSKLRYFMVDRTLVTNYNLTTEQVKTSW